MKNIFCLSIVAFSLFTPSIAFADEESVIISEEEMNIVLAAACSSSEEVPEQEIINAVDQNSGSSIDSERKETLEALAIYIQNASEEEKQEMCG